jgi:hypothetical protein
MRMAVMIARLMALPMRQRLGEQDFRSPIRSETVSHGVALSISKLATSPLPPLPLHA